MKSLFSFGRFFSLFLAVLFTGVNPNPVDIINPSQVLAPQSSCRAISDLDFFKALAENVGGGFCGFDIFERFHDALIHGYTPFLYNISRIDNDLSGCFSIASKIISDKGSPLYICMKGDRFLGAFEKYKLSPEKYFLEVIKDKKDRKDKYIRKVQVEVLQNLLSSSLQHNLNELLDRVSLFDELNDYYRKKGKSFAKKISQKVYQYGMELAPVRKKKKLTDDEKESLRCLNRALLSALLGIPQQLSFAHETFRQPIYVLILPFLSGDNNRYRKKIMLIQLGTKRFLITYRDVLFEDEPQFAKAQKEEFFRFNFQKIDGSVDRAVIMTAETDEHKIQKFLEKWHERFRPALDRIKSLGGKPKSISQTNRAAHSLWQELGEVYPTEQTSLDQILEDLRIRHPLLYQILEKEADQPSPQSKNLKQASLRLSLALLLYQFPELIHTSQSRGAPLFFQWEDMHQKTHYELEGGGEYIGGPETLRRMRYHLEKNISMLRNGSPNPKALEVGAAGGHLLQILRELGFNPYGVDYYTQCVMEGRTRFDLPNLITGDVRSLPYKNDLFDFTTSSYLFAEIQDSGADTDPAAAELARVSKNGSYHFHVGYGHEDSMVRFGFVPIKDAEKDNGNFLAWGYIYKLDKTPILGLTPFALATQIENFLENKNVHMRGCDYPNFVVKILISIRESSRQQVRSALNYFQSQGKQGVLAKKLNETFSERAFFVEPETKRDFCIALLSFVNQQWERFALEKNIQRDECLEASN